MSIYCTSDLHADFGENWSLLEKLPDCQYQADTLIVAGDIADRADRIERTLELLRSRFGQVFYTPGNHELWVRRDWRGSNEKLEEVMTKWEKVRQTSRAGGAGRGRGVRMLCRA